MTGLDWARAKRWDRKPRPLGAMTDKRRRYLAARQEQLRREAASRDTARRFAEQGEHGS